MTALNFDSGCPKKLLTAHKPCRAAQRRPTLRTQKHTAYKTNVCLRASRNSISEAMTIRKSHDHECADEGL